MSLGCYHQLHVSPQVRVLLAIADLCTLMGGFIGAPMVPLQSKDASHRLHTSLHSIPIWDGLQSLFQPRGIFSFPLSSVEDIVPFPVCWGTRKRIEACVSEAGVTGAGCSRLLQKGLKENGSVLCTVPAEVSLGRRLSALAFYSFRDALIALKIAL